MTDWPGSRAWRAAVVAALCVEVVCAAVAVDGVHEVVLEKAGVGKVSRLPVSIRIVLESVLRNCDGKKVTADHVRELAAWKPVAARTDEIPFVVADSNAKVRSNVRVQSIVRLRVNGVATERLPLDEPTTGKYVEVMKAIDRNTGKPTELAFDERGMPVLDAAGAAADARPRLLRILRRRPPADVLPPVGGRPMARSSGPASPATRSQA